MEAKDYEDGQLVLAHGRLHRADKRANVLGAREKYEEHEVRFLCGGCADEWEVRKVQDDAEGGLHHRMIHDQEAREVPVVCLACEWSWCIIQRDAELKKEGEVEPKP